MYSAEQSGRGQSPTDGPERGCQPATFAKKMSAAKTAANLAREEWPACGTGEIGGGFWGWIMVDRPGQGCWADKTNGNYIRSYPAGRVRLVRFNAVLDGKVGCLVHVSRYRRYGVA